MAKYRAIYQAIWKDPDFQNYGPEAKLVFIYLCTNQSTSESGIYPITEKTIADETGVKKETVCKLLANLLKNVYYDEMNHFVYVRRFRIYNAGGRPELIQKAVATEFKLYKQTYLWCNFIEDYPDFKQSVLAVGIPPTPPLTSTNTNTITNTKGKDPMANGLPTVNKPLDNPLKKLYGVGNNIKLTDEEYQKLLERFSEVEAKKRIDELSTYHNLKKYTDHYLTILRWANKDVGRGNGHQGTQNIPPAPGSIPQGVRIIE